MDRERVVVQAISFQGTFLCAILKILLLFYTDIGRRDLLPGYSPLLYKAATDEVAQHGNRFSSSGYTIVILPEIDEKLRFVLIHFNCLCMYDLWLHYCTLVCSLIQKLWHYFVAGTLQINLHIQWLLVA